MHQESTKYRTRPGSNNSAKPPKHYYGRDDCHAGGLHRALGDLFVPGSYARPHGFGSKLLPLTGIRSQAAAARAPAVLIHVSGTIGQPDASGAMTGGNYSLTGGFWASISVVQTAGAPPLYISVSGNTVTVYWQSVSGWSLQQNGNLTVPNDWTTSSGVTTLGGTNSFRIDFAVRKSIFPLEPAVIFALLSAAEGYRQARNCHSTTEDTLKAA